MYWRGVDCASDYSVGFDDTAATAVVAMTLRLSTGASSVSSG